MSLRSVSPTLTGRIPFHRRVWSKLVADIDPGSVHVVSVYMSFLTGLTAAPSFAACFVWCGFQTGNAAQLGLAIARLFTPDHQKTFSFQKMDQQALTSLLSFISGTLLGQIGNRVGGRRRAWLVGSTMGTMLLMMAATLAAHLSGEDGLANGRGDPSWKTPVGMTALGFLSAAMGLQGAIGTWIDLFNDPFLFAFKHVHTRDIRAFGCFALILGALISRVLLGILGSIETIGIVIGFRAVLAVWWFLLPDAPFSEEVQMLDIWKGWKLPYNLNIICGYKAFSYLVVSWVSGMSVWMIGFLADILDTEVGGLASYSYDPSTMQNASCTVLGGVANIIESIPFMY
ncbi:uncharacterized protein L203_102066 [Cryptococcus depauperatus CBS 7841]|uniref:Uncharacterized protein n=1 Tax=Cryptococcus depauperatus CBS 7841 TaxID=1295531 RepID=A0AAJ8JR89_9TREE